MEHERRRHPDDLQGEELVTIHPIAQQAADDFVSYWQPLLETVPPLALDYSWPSVSAVDVITFPLRLRQDYTEFDRFVLRGAAAYLCILSERTWREFGAVAEIRWTPENGCTIAAIGGPQIPPGEECLMFVEHDLGVLLADLPSPMPVIGKFSRQIGALDNYLSSFGIGLLTGLSPGIEGPWSRQTLDSFSHELGLAVRYLAGTTASYYARAFPDEPLGQVAGFFLHRLIFPVTMLDEALPHRSAVDGLMDFFDEFKVPRERALKVASNLVMIPDGSLSVAGLSYLVALAPNHDLREARMLAQSLGSQLGLFRRAMLDVRERLGLGGDWLANIELTPADERQIEREIELGYWPWLRMRLPKVKSFVQSQEIREVLVALAMWDWKRAVAALDSIIEVTPNDVEVRIQRCYLSLVNGEADLAAEQLRRLMTEPEAEAEPTVYKLLGSIDLARGDLAPAELNLRRAMKLVGEDANLRFEIHNDYGLLLLLRGDFYGALTEFDDALLLRPDALVPHLNRFRALVALSQFDEAEELRLKILRALPFDRGVFSELVWSGAETRWNELKGG